MSAASRVAAVVAAVGAISALVVWLVVPATRVVFAVSPALLLVLVTVLAVAGVLMSGLLRRRRDALVAEGDRRVELASAEVETRLGAERGRLLGRIDHELKNPVMATNLALDALRAAPAGSPQSAEAVDTIATQSAGSGRCSPRCARSPDIRTDAAASLDALAAALNRSARRTRFRSAATPTRSAATATTSNCPSAGRPRSSRRSPSAA